MHQKKLNIFERIVKIHRSIGIFFATNVRYKEETFQRKFLDMRQISGGKM